MVHLRRGDAASEVKGRIDLSAEGVVFTGKDGDAVSIAFEEVRRAKRLRGSPVLLLEWTRDGDAHRTAFYFSQPPPLEPPEPGTTTIPGDPFTTRPAGAFGAIRRTSKRRHQKTNIQYLQTVGIRQKELIQAWADEIMQRRVAP
jgi:hypothetical protein